MLLLVAYLIVAFTGTHMSVNADVSADHTLPG